MLISVTTLFIGFIVLMWSADRFILGASALARNLGVSPLIIGLTIVGFGTSAPEMLVSAIAAISGSPNIGIGNAIGSNITNIALVLGITALIAPMSVHSDLLRREFPILFIIMLTSLLLLIDRQMERIDGVILLTGMAVFIYWITRLGMRDRDKDPLADEFASEIPRTMSTLLALFWLGAGLLLMLGSSRILVWAAVNIAQALQISDLVIGLTVVAIGTSLPELAASVVSARKGEHDLAIGNVMGSNMFNILAVMGLPGAIAPSAIPEAVLTRDYPVMVGLTVLLFFIVYGVAGTGKINRFWGSLLLVCFFSYEILLYVSGD